MRCKITKPAVIIATICYMVLITVLSLVKFSDDTIKVEIANIDKVVHFCFYFGMNFLLLLMYHLYTLRTKVWQIIGVTCLTVTYGFIIEVIQLYVGRDFDIGDIMANAVGATLSLALYSSIRSRIIV